jgi:hypothetical protein
MNRRYVGAVTLLVVVLSGSGIARAETSIGVGYEAMFLGDFLQGASVRAWFDNKWGVEGNLMQASVDTGYSDSDAWLLAGKVMYCPIVRENSQFYVGFEGGFGQVDDNIIMYSGDNDVVTYGPLFGAEYRFQGLPELGFNWEVGYRFTTFDNEYYDIDLNGVFICLGVHYSLQ